MDGSLNGFINCPGARHRSPSAAGERAFIDGPAPLFYRPTRIRYNDGGLYVWDFNVLRRLDVEGGAARGSTTVAGMANPVYDMRFARSEPSERIVLPFSHLTDFIHREDGIMISDPKRGVIWLAGYSRG